MQVCLHLGGPALRSKHSPQDGIGLNEHIDRGLIPASKQLPQRIDANNRTAKVRITYQPTEPGEKVYVIKVPVQQGEVDKDNNQLERAVYVQDTKQIKVLYVVDSG